MSFKEKDYGWPDDGQRPITIAHLELSTQVSEKYKSAIFEEESFFMKFQNPFLIFFKQVHR